MKSRSEVEGGRVRSAAGTGNGETKARILFWNVAGINEKDEEFWEFVTTCEVVGLTETWITEEEWVGWERRLPKEFSWRCQPARKEAVKGRASGGIITGVRRGMEVIREEDTVVSEVEGLQERRVRLGSEVWRILTIYNNGESEAKLSEIDRFVGDERQEGKLLIGGDFNARVGEKGTG